MRILTFFTALALSVAAMVWAAAPPTGASAINVARIVAPARESLAALHDWLRPGPVEGYADWQSAAQTVEGGDAARGEVLMTRYGCGACHEIPGIAGARGTVGPPLHNLADRAYLAGVLSNTPGGLIRWLLNPPAHSPETAMPDLGLNEGEARHIAAFLMTLRRSD